MKAEKGCPFHLLPVGARFEFEGSAYRKSNPLLAVAEEDGRRRVVPRSAAVTPLDRDGMPPAAKADEPLTAESVRAAVAGCHDTLAGRIAGLPLEPAERGSLLEELERARRTLLKRLSIGD